jgi:hypothetical protein
MDGVYGVYGFFGFAVLIILIWLFFQSRRKKKTKFALENIDSFSPTHIFCSDYTATGVAIDSSQNKIAFSDQKRKIYVYDFEKIISVETVIDGNSVYKTERGSQVVGAVVGGILLGGAGLLIGALTGKKSKKEKISKISILVGVSDLDKPSHEIIFFFDSKPKNKSGLVVQVSGEKADEWAQRFDAVLSLK